jgi:outer membrane receptor protein involved in Fe transport
MRTDLTPRLDYQLSPNNTLTARYQYLQNRQTNSGVGALVEKSQGFTLGNEEHLLQLSDIQVLGPRTLDETRFQYIRSRVEQNAVDSAASTVIPGADISGGNAIFQSADLNNRLEFQNYISMSRDNHLFKFGGRLRVCRESSQLLNNSNGNFTFDSIAANKPSQYTLTIGPPIANLKFADAGFFAQDDWKLRPYLTVSYGMRYETQTSIPDKSDFAPRIGLSWGWGRSQGSHAIVLRAGWGMFHEQFP